MHSKCHRLLLHWGVGCTTGCMTGDMSRVVFRWQQAEQNGCSTRSSIFTGSDGCSVIPLDALGCTGERLGTCCPFTDNVIGNRFIDTKWQASRQSECSSVLISRVAAAGRRRQGQGHHRVRKGRGGHLLIHFQLQAVEFGSAMFMSLLLQMPYTCDLATLSSLLGEECFCWCDPSVCL